MQIRLGLLPAVIFLSLLSTAHAANFTFSFQPPTQCDTFPVTWSGGTPPYRLVLTPLFGTSRTFTIPASSITNGQGSFQAQMPFPEKQQFIMSMSDASGYGTGGTTQILTVGPQVGTNNCNTTDPGVDFFFELNTALQQCRPYTFGNYVGAVQPITIYGAIPGGQTFFILPPTGPTSFDWDADVAAGTSVVFIMYDSQGRQGGSSDLKLVGISNDATCLDSTSPVSVSQFPSPITSSPSSASGSSSNPSSSSRSSSSANPTGGTANGSKPGTGVIIAAICASLLGIGATIGLVVFFLRRRKNQGPYFDGYGRRSQFHAVDLGADPFSGGSEDHLSPPAQLNPYPFTANAPGSHGGSPSSHNLLGNESQYGSDTTYPPMQSRYGGSTQAQSRRFTGTESAMESLTAGSSAGEGTSTWQSPSITSSGARKAAMAGVATYKPPPRFILHTDLEELQPPPEEEEVIELPPQYSESRAPIAGLSNTPPQPPMSGKRPPEPGNAPGSSSPPYR